MLVSALLTCDQDLVGVPPGGQLLQFEMLFHGLVT